MSLKKRKLSRFEGLSLRPMTGKVAFARLSGLAKKCLRSDVLAVAWLLFRRIK